MQRMGIIISLVVWAIGALAQGGSVQVIDGDTLDITGERIRLHGIDAPERDQTCSIKGQEWDCGIAAWGYLIQMLAGQVVTCDRRDLDRYGRTLAVCLVNGEDIGARMVAEGWALAYRDYSLAYDSQEGLARTTGLGLWQGDFVPPWDWRRGERLEAVEVIPKSCAIKGNIAKNGARIYHVPGGRHYEQTVIDEGRGERWFCGEKEAVAEGWRRSQQ